MRRTADFFSWGIRFLVRPGDRVAVFMEGPAHYSVGGLLREGLAGLPAETEVFGFIRDYPEAASRDKGRDSLIGVPSQMYRLACAAPQLRPRTVLLSADYVPESVTRFLEERWKCKVFTHWGMSETGYGGGVQCEAGEGYHLREDLLVEITDPHSGRPLPPGAWGEVTVTTMRRAGMPLIRYRTGDLGRLLTAPCPCGCLKPRLDKVMGRIGEGIRLDGGAVITIQMLDEELLQIPGIREYEVCWRPESRRLEFVIDTGAEAGGGSARRDPDKSEASGSPDSGEEPAGNEKIGEEVRRVVREMSGGTVSAEISYGGVHGSGGNLKRKIKYVPG